MSSTGRAALDKTHSKTGLARQVNRGILDAAARMDHLLATDDHEVLQFVCECGCLGRVVISPSDYIRDNGAWVVGHRRKESLPI